MVHASGVLQHDCGVQVEHDRHRGFRRGMLRHFAFGLQGSRRKRAIPCIDSSHEGLSRFLNGGPWLYPVGGARTWQNPYAQRGFGKRGRFRPGRARFWYLAILLAPESKAACDPHGNDTGISVTDDCSSGFSRIWSRLRHYCPVRLCRRLSPALVGLSSCHTAGLFGTFLLRDLYA